MVKLILKNYLKDRLLLILFYVLTLSSVVVFFHLSEPANSEFFYPLSIGFFLLFVYLIIDWFRYYPTNRAVELMRRGFYAELQPTTEEQKAFQQFIHKLISEHTRRTTEMNEQNKERFYFLSHWMHYLKTPVSVMELILNNEEKDASVAFEKVQQENKRLHMSIEQGLTMIRMESFETDLEVKSVDLVATLRKLINSRKRECIYQSIFPSIDYSGKEAYVVTDPKWNDILLDQIISNAIKYSGCKSGSKKLVFQIKKADGRITLAITDEGVGIPPYDLERVFQPFFTGENGRNYPNSTGIGLYLCKKIADKLGQTIMIQSEVTKGTTVTIGWVSGKAK